MKKGKYYRNPEDELKNSMRQEFFSELKNHLESVGYRADLSIVGSKKTGKNKHTVKVKFNTELSIPQDKDLMSLVAQSFDGYEISWESLVLDDETGEIYFDVVPELEIIPLKSISEIPPEFVSVGTALYKKASDAEKTVHEIWELKKNADGGLALYKRQDDYDKEEEKVLRSGDLVHTPYGVGRIEQFDEVGNALVQVGKLKKMVADGEFYGYRISNEKKKLFEYYKEMYGDEEYARQLVENL